MRSWLLAILLLCGGSYAGAAQDYMNPTYGYSVQVPDGVRMLQPASPLPNHGITVELGGRRNISIDGSYDAAFFGSAMAALRQTLSYEHWAGKPFVRATRLAGLPAARAERGHNGRRQVRIAAYRTRGAEIAVFYEIDLDTDTTHAARDEAVFNSILRSFTLHPMPR
ncbi:MAG TPA: hypothetical protein VND19_06565 [Acetobacteraceae bacterium]|nr:hypothetical protein [Acetobacteraceae bacterium]